MIGITVSRHTLPGNRGLPAREDRVGCDYNPSRHRVVDYLVGAGVAVVVGDYSKAEVRSRFYSGHRTHHHRVFRRPDLADMYRPGCSNPSAHKGHRPRDILAEPDMSRDSHQHTPFLSIKVLHKPQQAPTNDEFA